MALRASHASSWTKPGKAACPHDCLASGSHSLCPEVRLPSVARPVLGQTPSSVRCGGNGLAANVSTRGRAGPCSAGRTDGSPPTAQRSVTSHAEAGVTLKDRGRVWAPGLEVKKDGDGEEEAGSGPAWTSLCSAATGPGTGVTHTAFPVEATRATADLTGGKRRCLQQGRLGGDPTDSRNHGRCRGRHRDRVGTLPRRTRHSTRDTHGLPWARDARVGPAPCKQLCEKSAPWKRELTTA